MSTSTIAKNKRITGTDREKFLSDVKKLYDDQRKSIREICEITGRSYGAVHRTLSEAGVTLRARGGSRPAKPKKTK